MKKIFKFLLLIVGSVFYLTSCHSHNYDSAYEGNEKGHYHVCTECGKKSEIEEHSYTVKKIQEESCLAKGIYKYTCKVCNYSYIKEIKTEEHDIVTAKEILPTHTEDGLSSYTYCSLCGVHITEPTIIPALGHDVSLTYVNNGDNHDGVCSCGEVIFKSSLHSFSAKSEDLGNGVTRCYCVCGASEDVDTNELNRRLSYIKDVLDTKEPTPINREYIDLASTYFSSLPNEYSTQVDAFSLLLKYSQVVESTFALMDEINTEILKLGYVTEITDAKLTKIDSLLELLGDYNKTHYLTSYKTYLAAKEAYEKYKAINLKAASTQQSAIVNAAMSFYQQHTQIQYDQYDYKRNVHALAEDATNEHKIYLDCSSFLDSVYYNCFNETIFNTFTYNGNTINPRNGTNVNTNNINSYSNANPFGETILHVTTSKVTTEIEKEQTLNNLINILQEGDLINYRHNNSGRTAGHIMMYIGNGKLIHCTGVSNIYDAYNDPMDNSSESQTDAERKIGAILIEDVTILSDKNHERYLFKSGSDTVTAFSVIRPVVRDLTLTEYGVSKLLNDSLTYEKYNNIGNQHSVLTGSNITYTIKITNFNDNDYGYVYIKNPLPEGVEFVKSDKGYLVDNSVIFQLNNVSKNSEVLLSYTVKVTGANKTKLLDDETTFNGARVNMLLNQITNKKFENGEVVDASKDLIYDEFDNMLDAIKAIYAKLGNNTVLKDIPSEKYFLTNTLKDYKFNPDAILADNVAGIIYGGGGYASGTSASERGFKYYNAGNNDCTVIMDSSLLEPGDIIATQTLFDAEDEESQYSLYLVGSNNSIYGLNDNHFSLVYDNDMDIQEFAHSLPYYVRFVVIRPSLSY